MRTVRTIVALALAGMLTIALGGCDEATPEEKARDKAQAAAEKLAERDGKFQGQLERTMHQKGSWGEERRSWTVRNEKGAVYYGRPSDGEFWCSPEFRMLPTAETDRKPGYRNDAAATYTTVAVVRWDNPKKQRVEANALPAAFKVKILTQDAFRRAVMADLKSKDSVLAKICTKR